MAVKTKKTFPNAVGANGQSSTVFTPVEVQLNNQDDLDVYVTLSGGTRVLQLRQSAGSTAQSSHPQVNDTTGLYFPAVSAGTTLYNYTLSTDNNTITFSTALPSGAVVSIERRTRDADSSYTNFASGSTIRATDLNNSSTEANFTAQEARNKAFELEGKIFGGEATGTSFISSDEIVDGTIVNADINNNAEIAVSKLANGSARQILQTAANGTDVEFTSNVDIPGTLDVTGNADIDSNLNVDGTLTVAGTADLNGNLDVDGDTNLDNTTIVGYINVTGVATVDNVQINGNEVRANSGNLNLDSANGTVDVNDNLNVTGTTTLDATTVDGVLDVNGSSTIDNVRIDGNEIDTTSGNLTIDSAGGTVTVDDNLTITGTLSAPNIDADTLDTIGSSQFLRSDTSDTFSATNHSITFADDTHLNIGSGSDLAIHHDGNHTYITQTNSGQTYAAFINGATFRTGANHKDVDKLVKANNRANVELYEGADSSATPTKRLETTSTGVTITGETKTTSLEIDGTDVTATAVELNKLDGYTGSTAELNKLDGYTGTAADLNEVVAGKNVVETISSTATDAQIPTAQAVNERVVELVTEVGGFHPIANETSFPSTNPDINDGAGTIVSIKALSSAFTTGSGVTTKVFTNGAGSGVNVTVNGLTQSTTYPAGRGMLLETTSTLHTYNFHRLTLDETGVANAQAAIDDWDERYYGPLGSEPNTRPGGGARVQGDLYFSTVDNQMKVWNNAASQWDDVASSASSNIITLSPAFNGSETEFTCSTVPVDAQSLLLSINGVIQKPNSGTSTPSEGYVKLANGKIKLASPPATGAPYFAVALGNTVSIGTPSPDTVGATELKNGEIANVHVSSSAAIAGTKISPNFGSQAVSTTGDLTIDTNTLYVDSSNNRVGIGTTSPDRKLVVTGDTNTVVKVIGATNGTSSLFLGDADDEDVGALTYNHTTEDLTITAADNIILTGDKVGIGTTSPSDFLHCVTSDFTLAKFESTSAGDTGPTMILYHNSASPADNDYIGGLYFHGNHSGNSVHNYSYIAAQSLDVTDGTEDSNIVFATSVAGATAERMRINGSNVGIGTTAPAEKLTLGDGDLKFFHSNAANAHRTTFIEFGNSSNRITSEANYGSDNSSNYTAGLKFTTKNFNGSSFTTVDALNIQANGRVGIGTTSPSTMLHATSGTSSNSAGMFENTDNSAYSSAAEGHLNNVLILKSTTTTGQNDQSVGIQFNLGLSGQTGSIQEIGAVRTASGEGALIFRTRNSSNGRIERFRIHSDGDCEINDGDLKIANGHGIDFNNTTPDGSSVGSELFDDYEEGTFTPILDQGLTGISYNVQTGHYTKIGNQVFAYVYILATATGSNNNGLRVGGLPFTNNGSSYNEGGGYVTYINGTFGTTTPNMHAMPWVPQGQSKVFFHTPEDGNNLQGSECNFANKYLIFHVRYHT